MEITERLKEIIKQETNTNIDIKTRNRQTVEMRSLYCNVLKELKPNKTLQAIGDTLELNHATVIHALKNYKMYEEYNPELKKFRTTILSYFTIDNEEELKELSEIDKVKQQMYKLTFENDKLKRELKEQIERPRHEYKIIDDLNNLMNNTKGTIQFDLIQDRLEAFYKMNNNIKL
ncbi:Chromosomal replication initiator, DnaA C-terminal [uncultured Caudovirales phage]|uniref:Chromosomal replication initiator, DnaA C-terminal n=1 Tax=uncultured Caudovirales phage TaxID=2100421 RepID=A0A6J5MNX5_9CAUD|nr:Chromosomal replication initiator, DnaA C-terminal [uncultured Caudovirales phage]